MNATTVAVISYDQTGSIRDLAEAASYGATEAGAEVRLLSATEATPADVEWADVVLFGTTTHYGSMSADVKQFLDSTGELWRTGRLADKVYGAFLSSVHGGHETTLEHFVTVFSHWGGIIVPPASTTPFQSHSTKHLEAARSQARRAVGVATRLRADRETVAAGLAG